MGRRLVIRKLVLVNFKSYAGSREIGPFNTNFTAVVGPNGSGKSNVIDSLLFVFGFRAKKMRHDKLSNLIHRSDEFPNLGSARVEVHFGYAPSLGEDTGPLDETLVVAREVGRDGSSSYYVNGRVSSYADVTHMLKAKGIDLDHKRFLILQGEVESIALMKPKADDGAEDGLLEYLEDIIGTSDYKKRIEELDEQLKTLATDATDKEQRASVVARDVAKLEVQRATIEEYCRVHNRTVTARSRLWQYQRYAANREQRLRTAETEEILAQQRKIETQMSEARAQEQAMITRATEVAEEISKIKAEASQVSKQLKKAQVAAALAQKRREQATQRRVKLERDTNTGQIAYNREQSWLDTHQHTLQDAEQHMRQLRTSLEAEQATLDKMQSALADKTGHLTAQIEDLQRQAEPARAQQREAEATIHAADAGISRAESELADARQHEAEVTGEARHVSERGMAAQKDVKALEKNLTKLDKRDQECAEERARAQQAFDAAQVRVSEIQPRVSAAHDARRSAQSRDRKEAQLLELREKHSIKGLYGRLGSLGGIDPRYDVAVSTAAPELNNYVVDSVVTAELCIRLLREHKIGATRFMVLDKLASPRQAGQFPAPRLYDLVTPSHPQFSKAFWAVLGDTLVTESIEEARSVAYGGSRRFKVVTLDGMLVTSSGAMTGGGAPLRGLMSRQATGSISLDELEALEQQLTSAKLDLEAARTHLASVQDEQAVVAQTRPDARTELEKARLSLQDLQTKMRSLKDRRNEAKETVARLESELVTIAKEAELTKSQARTTLEAAVTASQPLETQIEALRAQILEVGGLELRVQTAKVRDLSDQHAEYERRCTEITSEQARRSARLRQLAQDLEDLARELKSLPVNSDSGEDDTTVTNLERELRTLEGELTARDATLDEARAAASAAYSQTEEFRSSEIEIRSHKESLEEAAAETSARIKALDAQLESIEVYDLAEVRKLPDPSQPVNRARSEAPKSLSEYESTHETGALTNKAETQPDHMETDLLETDKGSHEHHEGVSESQIEDSQLARDGEIPREMTPDELDNLRLADLQATVAQLERALDTQKARYDPELLAQYRQRHNEWVQRQQVADTAVAAWERVKQDLEQLRQRRLHEFLAGFNAISSKLKEMYNLLTMGGNAELELVDSLDPFAEGILFSVMPPRKSWRNISDLSGGEKTLSSLALVFALHHYKPTPLYVMDEIDAALDFRNVSIIANYIRERTHDGQFVVISLRNNMFELASRLVGIYKVNNMSSSVAFDAIPEIPGA